MASPTEPTEERSVGEDPYGEYETRDGEMVIFEREFPEAWLKADVVHDVDV